MMHDFKKHYRICRSGTNGGEFPTKRLENEIEDEIRLQIADIYLELRKNGFFPAGYTERGDIRWMIALEDKVFGKLVAGMEKTPGSPDELEAMIAKARIKFEKIGNMPSIQTEIHGEI